MTVNSKPPCSILGCLGQGMAWHGMAGSCRRLALHVKGVLVPCSLKKRFVPMNWRAMASL